MQTQLADPTNYGNKPGDGPLRAGGQPVSGHVVEANDLPSTLSRCASQQVPALVLVRDLAAGPERVRSATTSYLPKGPGEKYDEYAARLERSVFYNVLRHTIIGLTGMVFRRDPVLSDDVPAPIAEHWENVDNMGTHGAVFARELLKDAITAGHAAVLVEYPRTEGRQTAADEKVAIRPYWVPIRKEHILSWRTTHEHGRMVLTQLVVREMGMEPAGMFGEREVVRYRVFYREDGIVGYRLLRITKDREVVEDDAGTYPTQTEIPVAEFRSSGSKGMFESDPPLLDLAYLNVAHYQGWSDYAYSIHKTNVPIFFAAGVDELMPEEGKAEVVVGPNSGIVSRNPQAKVEYVSHGGGALSESRQALLDLKADMATLGLAQLSPQTRAAETAEAKRIDKATSDSALSVSARGLQDGIERCLQFHANYLKLPEGGSVTVNRDFENLALTPQQIQAYSTLVEKGQLSLETMWQMLVEGNALPEAFDPLGEEAKLAAEAEVKRQMALKIAQQQPKQPMNGEKMPPEGTQPLAA